MDGFSCPVGGGPSWPEDEGGGVCSSLEPGGREGPRVRSDRIFNLALDTVTGGRKARVQLGIRGFMFA